MATPLDLEVRVSSDRTYRLDALALIVSLVNTGDMHISFASALADAPGYAALRRLPSGRLIRRAAWTMNGTGASIRCVGPKQCVNIAHLRPFGGRLCVGSYQVRLSYFTPRSSLEQHRLQLRSAWVDFEIVQLH
jgi:hypothetical protein